MTFAAFYSWQSDLPSRVNRNLIESAADDALKRLRDSGIQADPLDHATRSEPGTPDIAAAIFRKIDSASVFLGDVTLTGTIGQKRTPNPNVILELGYAVKSLTWSRIISVTNTAFGDLEQQPFHIKQRRWPIHYNLPEDASKKKVREARDGLADVLFRAFSTIANEVQSGTLELQFSEWSTRPPAGATMSIRSVLPSSPNDIPEYGRINIAGVGSIATPFENGQYYREVAEYIKQSEFLVPLRFCVTNRGRRPVNGVRFCLQTPLADGLFLTDCEQRTPNRSAVVFPQPDVAIGRDLVVERNDEEWEISGDCGKLGPSETGWLGAFLFCGASTDMVVQLIGNLFWDEMVDPFNVKLELRINAESREMSLQEIYDFEQQDDEEHGI